jgi:hypothetical protein
VLERIARLGLASAMIYARRHQKRSDSHGDGAGENPFSRATAGVAQVLAGAPR